jgi:sec-independent protein translocase protein TatB
MFDVAFSELVVIGLVALIVIGPERLPKVARTAGILLGRLQRYVNDVKADINREMQVADLKKMQDDVVTQVRDMEKSVNAQLQTVEQELHQSIATGIEEKAAATPAPDSAAQSGAAAQPAGAAQPAAAVESTAMPAPAVPAAAPGVAAEPTAVLDAAQAAPSSSEKPQA